MTLTEIEAYGFIFAACVVSILVGIFAMFFKFVATKKIYGLLAILAVFLTSKNVGVIIFAIYRTHYVSKAIENVDFWGTVRKVASMANSEFGLQLGFFGSALFIFLSYILPKFIEKIENKNNE